MRRPFPLLGSLTALGCLLLSAATGHSASLEVGPDDFRISDMGPDANLSFRASRSAVAYNSTGHEYLVVWEGNDGAGAMADDESEIFGQRIDAATGVEIGSDFRISDMGPDGNIDFGGFTPAVAYNATDNEYLVVWEGDDDTGGLADNELEIFGQRLDAATGAEIGGDFRISDAGMDGLTQFEAFNAAVVYNADDNEYLVVWQADDNTGALVDGEFEIYGQRLNAATGAEVGTNDFRITAIGTDGNTGFRAFRPDVAYNPVDREYLVVWEGNSAALPDDIEIHGQRLASDGTPAGTAAFRISDLGPDGDSGFTANAASVAHGAEDDVYLVVWVGTDDIGTLAGTGTEIFGQRIAGATGEEVGANDFRVSDMGEEASTSAESSVPDVAYNPVNGEFVVVWEGDDVTGGLVNDEFEIFGQRIDAATGAEIGVNDFRVSSAGPDGTFDFGAFRPALACDIDQNGCLAVWEGTDDAGTLVVGEFEILGQGLSDPVCGNGFVDSGESCDDGNASNADACTNACASASCGDGFLQAGEECDDGDTVSGDGCSADCATEADGGGTAGNGDDGDGGGCSLMR